MTVVELEKAASRQAFSAGTHTIGDPGRAFVELTPGVPLPQAFEHDVALSASSLAGMSVLAASVRGVQHRFRAKPRQDAYAVAAAGPHELVVVLCDGVGSLEFSHEAAQAASRVIAEFSADHSWDEAFAAANTAVRTLSSDDRPMATTATALRVRWTADGWSGELAYVGDSPAWALSADGAWTPLSDSKEDEELHTTAAKALPADELSITVRTVELAAETAIFVMSDGVGNPLGWCPDVQLELSAWWAEQPDLFTFGSQVSFGRKSHVDDRTVVGIWPATPPAREQ